MPQIRAAQTSVLERALQFRAERAIGKDPADSPEYVGPYRGVFAREGSADLGFDEVGREKRRMTAKCFRGFSRTRLAERDRHQARAVDIRGCHCLFAISEEACECARPSRDEPHPGGTSPASDPAVAREALQTLGKRLGRRIERPYLRNFDAAMCDDDTAAGAHFTDDLAEACLRLIGRIGVRHQTSLD